MRRITSCAMLLVGLLGWSSGAAAQEPRTVDLGLLLRYSMLDSKVADEAGQGIGARFGVFLLPNTALEVTHAASQTSDDPETRQGSLHLHLVRHQQLGASNWTGMLGAGWVRDRTRPGDPAPLLETDGASVILGLQRNFTARVGLRADVIYDYLPVTRFDADRSSAGHTHFQIGLNIRWPAPPRPTDSDNDIVRDEMDRCPGTPANAYVNYFGCVPEPDTDNDGVLDSADRCPNTPAGTAVNASGCALDGDGDGVADAQDRCPNTPAGTAVNASGCPLDSDGDGVADAQDRCPNTAAGTAVNATGCPRDSDGDNVPDAQDRCPNTPMGTRVDANGCQLIFEEGQRNIVLEGVNFETGSSRLTAESQVILDRVAESLVAATDVNVEVQGHTDNTGSLAANNRISQARANAVRDYLISKGVAAERLTARGYGPSQPAASNATAEGRAQNRRVELRRTN